MIFFYLVWIEFQLITNTRWFKPITSIKNKIKKKKKKKKKKLGRVAKIKEPFCQPTRIQRQYLWVILE